MPFTPRQRRHRVLLRRWSHSLAVRLPAKLLREAGFTEDTPLTADLDTDGCLRLRREDRFDRWRFSCEQTTRLSRLPITEPSWVLLRLVAASQADAPALEPPPATDGGWESTPTYLDSGMILPLVAPEATSEQLLRRFGVEQRLLVTSQITLLEVSAALALKPLPPQAIATCQKELLRLLRGGGISHYQLSDADLARTPAWLAQPALPALHPLAALHLVTALASGCSRLMSPDPRLRQAAAAAGLLAHRPDQWPTRLRLPLHRWMGDWPPLAAAP